MAPDMAFSLPKESFLALAAVAWADGSFDPAEGLALARVAREAGLSPAELVEIELATSGATAFSNVDVSRLSRGQRVLTYALATWLAQLDAVVTPEERGSLAELALLLELPEGVRRRAAAAAAEAAALPEGDRPERYDFGALRSRIVAKLGDVEAE